MPLQVAETIQENVGINIKSYLVGKSGTGFHEYLREDFEAQYGLEEGQTLLDKIATGKYDYVVLQQITYFIADKDSTEVLNATKTLCQAIEQAGSTPVFYEMGWRLQSLNQTGREMILDEAIKYGVNKYAPCSRAWAKVRAERPDLELHNLPDTDHPGTLGTYLNICCFYAAITGESPVGLPANVRFWPRFGAFDKDEARAKLKTLELDEYHATMPEWMQMISAMVSETEIDAATAKYLQETAWESYQEIISKIQN